MEKRQNNSSQFCPDHDKVYKVRMVGQDLFICCGYRCEWSCPARREKDKEVPTIEQVKKEWQ